MSFDYINEAFRKLDALNEEVFDTSLNGLNELSNFHDQDDATDLVKVIDPDADTEESISDSYIGKVIINCNVCHSHIFESKEDIVIDDEGVVNPEMTCPYCGEMSGFTVVGEIQPFEEEPFEDDREEATETPESDDSVDTEAEENPESEDTALSESYDGADNYRMLKDFLAAKGYSVDSRAASNYLWSVIDLFEGGSIAMTPESLEQWLQDTKMNYPEDLTALSYDNGVCEGLFSKKDKTEYTLNEDSGAHFDGNGDAVGYVLVCERKRPGDKSAFSYEHDDTQYADYDRAMQRARELNKKAGAGSTWKVVSTDEAEKLFKDTEPNFLTKLYHDGETNRHTYQPSMDPVPLSVKKDSTRRDTKLAKDRAKYGNPSRNPSQQISATSTKESLGEGIFDFFRGKKQQTPVESEPAAEIRKPADDTHRKRNRFVVIKGGNDSNHWEYASDIIHRDPASAARECRKLEMSPENGAIPAYKRPVFMDCDVNLAETKVGKLPPKWDSVNESADKSVENRNNPDADTGALGWVVAGCICDNDSSGNPTNYWSQVSTKKYPNKRAAKEAADKMNSDRVGGGKVAYFPIEATSAMNIFGKRFQSEFGKGDRTILADKRVKADGMKYLRPDTEPETATNHRAWYEKGAPVDTTDSIHKDSRNWTPKKSKKSQKPNKKVSESIHESIEDVRGIKRFLQSELNGKGNSVGGQNSARFATWLAEAPEASWDYGKIAEVAYLMGYDVYETSHGYFDSHDYLIVCSGVNPEIYLADLADEDKEFWEITKSDLTKLESLNEGLEDLSMTANDTHVEISEGENGEVTVTMGPTDASEETGELEISPVSDETISEIEANNEEEPEDSEESEGEEVDVDIEEVDEEGMNELGESYLKNIYSNVASFKTTNVSSTDSKMIVEGTVTFTSGTKKNTGFVFEAYSANKDGSVRFIGSNKHLTKSRYAFALNGVVKNKKLLPESLTYNYNAGELIVRGTVTKK